MGTAEALLEHALKNNGHRCHCNHPLTFNKLPGGFFECLCERCERKAKNDGKVVFVVGCAEDPDLAFEDFLEAVKRAD